jgi:anthranilate phosphoribosyltransferase
MAYRCASLIKEIGRGKEGARHLSLDQARQLYSAMLDAEVSELELGAVLIALRVKGESIDELTGFCQAAQAGMRRVHAPASDKPTIVFPSYNGARRRPNLLPLLAGALAREGYPVLVHGHVEDPTGRVTTHDVFEALHWPMVKTPDPLDPFGQAVPVAATGAPSKSLSLALAGAYQQHLPLFVSADVLHPGLTALLERRRVLGVRNSTHTIVKLIQPVVGPCVLVTSYTHPEFFHLQRAVLGALDTAALVLRGHEGEAVAHPQKAPRMDGVHGGQTWCVDEGDSGFADMPDKNPDRDAAHTASQVLAMLSRVDQEGLGSLPSGLLRQIHGVQGVMARLSA